MSFLNLNNDILSILFEYLYYKDLCSFVNLRKKYASLVTTVYNGNPREIKNISCLLRFKNLRTIKPDIGSKGLTDFLILSKMPNLRNITLAGMFDEPSLEFLDILNDRRIDVGNKQDIAEFTKLTVRCSYILGFITSFFCDKSKRQNIHVTMHLDDISFEVIIDNHGYITVSSWMSQSDVNIISFLSKLIENLIHILHVKKIDKVIVKGRFFTDVPLFTDYVEIYYNDSIFNLSEGAGYPNLLFIEGDDYEYKRLEINLSEFGSDEYPDIWDYASQNTIAYNGNLEEGEQTNKVLEYLDLPFSDEINLNLLFKVYPNLDTVGIYVRNIDKLRNIIKKYPNKHFIIYVDERNYEEYNKFASDNIEINVI